MTAPTPEQRAEWRELLASAVDGDDKDTRRVLDFVPALLDEVGAALNLSHERARQLEVKGLFKLRLRLGRLVGF